MSKIPKHIVLFPDGNRRWARERGLPTIKGHWQGFENLKRFCTWCKERGVKIGTAFGFSTENWKRPEAEIKYLMELFKKVLSDKNYIQQLYQEGIRLKVIGQKERLPASLQKIIEKVENSTKDNKSFHLNLAVSYGGRWDVLQAVKQIVAKKISAQQITEELIGGYLSTAGLPDPDLIIRAGGEKRLSNFVLWQGAYSELYFSPKYWPDFTEKDLDEALVEYTNRQRKFGT